ncbi:MAG TPA: hypothetical protein VD886_26405 [Herpetosiphonaceae bacterium]|nr:hypothetical protein [Herpetosiphonaceae bacterium]
MHRLIGFALMLVILFGCGAQAEPTPLPKARLAPTGTPPAAEQPAAATPSPGAQSQIPAGWTHVNWEGLRIAYPPTSNPIFRPFTPEMPLRAEARLLPTCPPGVDCPFPVTFRIYPNDGGDVPTWVERNRREGFHDLANVTVDGRAGLSYQLGNATDGPGAPRFFFMFSHGTDILEVEFGAGFGDEIIPALDFDPAPETTLAPGQLAYLNSAEALDVWSAASGGQRVVEHPRLRPGSQVAIVQLLADAVHIRTAEGTEGWLRQPASQILSREAVPDDEIARFGEGGRVAIVHPTGIPLRELPHSESGKLRDKLVTGTSALVYEVRGDWLYLTLDDGAAGWARWYYDGQIYIQ